MNSDVKVSVVIPVYRVEKYIHQCIDSVINQTLKNIEIIIKVMTQYTIACSKLIIPSGKCKLPPYYLFPP